MVESETHRARYVFKVKEYVDGTPWIYLETWDKDLPILLEEGKPKAFLGFDLPKGTTYDEARQLADYLDNHITEVTYTVFK